MAAEELPMGEDGFSGDEIEVDESEDESDAEAAPSPMAKDEIHATIVAYVARRVVNTVDSRPGGYAWFSA